MCIPPTAKIPEWPARYRFAADQVEDSLPDVPTGWSQDGGRDGGQSGKDARTASGDVFSAAVVLAVGLVYVAYCGREEIGVKDMYNEYAYIFATWR